jgi:hypothetical protein
MLMWLAVATCVCLQVLGEAHQLHLREARPVDPWRTDDFVRHCDVYLVYCQQQRQPCLQQLLPMHGSAQQIPGVHSQTAAAGRALLRFRPRSNLL